METDWEKIAIESGEMIEALRGLDLSRREDVEKMYDLSRIRGELILTNAGDFPRMLAGKDEDKLLSCAMNYLTHFAEVTQTLERIAKDPSNLSERQLWSGHNLVKLGADCGGINSWMGKDNHYGVIQSANEGNSNLFLGVMSASSSLASQALNRYDTGLFLNEASCKGEELGELGVPVKYPELSRVVEAHESIFPIWNKVMLKYISNVIQREGFVFSGEVPGKDLTAICNDVPGSFYNLHKLTDIFYDFSERGCYMDLFAEFRENPEKYAERIEEKAKISADKIEEFEEVLRGYDERLEFAKPSVGGRD